MFSFFTMLFHYAFLLYFSMEVYIVWNKAFIIIKYVQIF